MPHFASHRAEQRPVPAAPERLIPPESLNRNTAFNHLWIGETASQFGFQVAGLAFTTTAIVVLHASSAQVGLLNGLQTIAFLLIGLPAGAWVDRWRKRRTMITADIVRAVALATVPLAWWFGELSIYHLMAVVAVFGFGTVFFDVAYQSFVPAIVHNTQIGQANGRMEASVQVARVGGPGIGGWLIGLMTAPTTLMVTAGTLAISATAVATIPGREEPPRKRPGVKLWSEVREGIDYVRGEPLLGPLFVCIAAAGLFGQGVWTLMPLLALRELGMSAQAFGTLLSVGAIGGVLGAMANRRIVRNIGEGHTIALFNTVAACVNFGMPLAVLAGRHAWLILVLVGFIASFFQTVYNIVQLSLRQRICPLPLLGRLNATFRFAVWGAMPIGAMLSGWFAGIVGIVPALYTFLAMALVAALAMWFTPVARANRVVTCA
ncbi:MAG: MFS transporter [Ancrocorticia sp.]|nr:MFS transporter [Ancrocorticia sp.]MCI1895869.1 MFS transporter [Ancrocorticia sp.]MCI1932528.1 MFS transporter [Ancrocorticia sp.]MCI1963720.1 MFS transporter [Ancrocorticia sp.]MCI2003039.1 MFS transporter [Ancrocorticia sp.]